MFLYVIHSLCDTLMSLTTSVVQSPLDNSMALPFLLKLIITLEDVCLLSHWRQLVFCKFTACIVVLRQKLVHLMCMHPHGIIVQLFRMAAQGTQNKDCPAKIGTVDSYVYIISLLIFFSRIGRLLEILSI